MFSPKLSKIARFCFIEIKIFLGEDPQTPHFILSKRAMVTQDFLVQKSPPHTHTHTHTHTRTDHPFASEKILPDVSIKENIGPRNIHRILPMAFFFLLFDVRPLLLKISGSAHVMYS